MEDKVSSPLTCSQVPPLGTPRKKRMENLIHGLQGIMARIGQGNQDA